MLLLTLILEKQKQPRGEALVGGEREEDNFSSPDKYFWGVAELNWKGKKLSYIFYYYIAMDQLITKVRLFL